MKHMIFPYGFNELVTQFARYRTLNERYNDAVERVISEIFSSQLTTDQVPKEIEGRVTEIRALVKVQTETIALTYDIFGGLIETHRPTEGSFPKVAYLLRKRRAVACLQDEKFYLYKPFLNDGKKPSGLQRDCGIVEACEVESCVCKTCNSDTPIIHKVSESEASTKMMVCLNCDAACIIGG